MSSDYDFTQDWFDDDARKNWDQLLPNIQPKRILEIGSFEGASACYLIDTLGPKGGLELFCVDSWAGGLEHNRLDMGEIEARFDANVEQAKSRCPEPVQVNKLKGKSDQVLAYLLTEGRQGYFDFVYVDGSHQAPDVLCDAVLGFRLLKPEGVMAFDDYLWFEELPGGMDLIRSPKLAIDAFTNIYGKKLDVLRAPLYQLYIKKISD